MRPLSLVGRLAVASSLVASATPALAHHVMGGRLPATFGEGLLSGLGHPVIGPDHLAFIIAIGFAAALVPAGFGLIAAFIATSVAGVLVHAGAVTIPGVEGLIAVSVIAAGSLIAIAGKKARVAHWLVLALAAGLLHGYAFGESIVGAERGVLGAYLAGLAIVMAAVAATACMAARAIIGSGSERPIVLRAAGAIVGSVGVVFLAASLVAS